MPYTRITLLAGKPDSYLEAVSRSLQSALVTAFDVPADDCFQIFHQVRPNEFVFDRNYLGGPRSEQFVHFAITTGKPRTPEKKRKFYKKLVEELALNPGIEPENVMIVIANSQPEDWSFGGGRVWNEPRKSD